MLLAWSTVSVLVLLLPGFLFLGTIYVPGRFSREAAPLTPFAQAAIALLVSLAVHGLMLLLIPVCPAAGGVCVDMRAVLVLLQALPSREASAAELGRLASQSVPRVLGYLVATSVAGGLLGLLWGWLFAHTGLRVAAQHGWVARLAQRPRSWAFAYVTSKVVAEGKMLVYRGRLEDFGMMANGRFAYIVLTDPSRGYVDLRADPPLVVDARQPMGADGYGVGTPDALLESYLVIEGEDVESAVFERYELKVSSAGLGELSDALQRMGKPGGAGAENGPLRTLRLRCTLPWAPWRYVVIRFGTAAPRRRA
ncbi:MAG TPA: hypothetical protein VF665_11205 [Longimicrobium sp.]|jgi:hypothetical protein|uniref:hypothetical protein n=1 Tax=Longimicrobium sp. TaxID=2029185 RepID=UPI002ED7B03B